MVKTEKDWTGNNRSTFATLGASSHSKGDRQSEDFYATDPIAIDKLLAVFPLQGKIWECACGQGHLSRRLEEHGCQVLSTDLINRGFAIGGNFLTYNKLPQADINIILTTPPLQVC